jgi:hypothetical protein
MRYTYLGLLTLSILYSCSQDHESQQTTSAQDGRISLLDEGLDAWTYRGQLNASMDNDILSLSGSEDHPTAMLVSKEKFDNFNLKFDIKTSDIQSYILFRFNDKLKATPDRAGYMLSTDANPDQQNPIGTVINVSRSTIPEGFDATQWNTIEIEAANNLLMVSINGQRVAICNDKQFSRGSLAIAVPSKPGETVYYRNMTIENLVTIQVVEELLEDRYRANTSSPWETLFDGQSLKGWTPTGDGTWKVEDEAIHGYSGEKGGFLVSDKAYRNFYLKTKFRIIKEDNSGIFIRKSPDSAAVTITDAIECNIYDHNGPSHAYSTGSIATHARAWYEMIDYDSWNEMEIFAENDHIVMFVNGRKSSEAYVPKKFDKIGNICLQGGIKVFAEDKGPSDIYFKDLMIKSMDDQ